RDRILHRHRQLTLVDQRCYSGSCWLALRGGVGIWNAPAGKRFGPYARVGQLDTQSSRWGPEISITHAAGRGNVDLSTDAVRRESIPIGGEIVGPVAEVVQPRATGGVPWAAGGTLDKLQIRRPIEGEDHPQRRAVILALDRLGPAHVEGITQL